MHRLSYSIHSLIHHQLTNADILFCFNYLIIMAELDRHRWWGNDIFAFMRVDDVQKLLAVD
jgi:hypothetical protein